MIIREPSLALNAHGNPVVAFEVHLRVGLGPCAAETWARMSRLAIFHAPTGINPENTINTSKVVVNYIF